MIFEKDGNTMTVNKNCASSYLRNGWKEIKTGAVELIKKQEETTEQDTSDLDGMKTTELKIKAKELGIEFEPKITADELKKLIVEKLS